MNRALTLSDFKGASFLIYFESYGSDPDSDCGSNSGSGSGSGYDNGSGWG